MKITVIGAGYVGLVQCVCLADFGFDVTCIEKDSDKLKKYCLQLKEGLYTKKYRIKK